MADEHAMNARRSRVGKAPDEHATCGMTVCSMKQLTAYRRTIPE